jgi:hypothetical protein
MSGAFGHSGETEYPRRSLGSGGPIRFQTSGRPSAAADVAGEATQQVRNNPTTIRAIDRCRELFKSACAFHIDQRPDCALCTIVGAMLDVSVVTLNRLQQSDL